MGRVSVSAVPPPPPAGGLQGLLAEALRGAGDVVRGEIALFRQEMADNLRSLIVGLAAMTGAAVFAVVGFLVLIDALVTWLATVVGSEALSALIVGVVFLVIGIVLALTAKSRFSLDALVPTRTGRQLRQDASVIKEHVDA
ncbi:phage holin family protein [Methylobacterium sp. WL116]|nr:phage holin family protein [Methylobacterium sp. WL116]